MSKRKPPQPFKFRSSEEDNWEQYRAVFGSTSALPRLGIELVTPKPISDPPPVDLPAVSPTVGENDVPTEGQSNGPPGGQTANLLPRKGVVSTTVMLRPPEGQSVKPPGGSLDGPPEGQSTSDDFELVAPSPGQIVTPPGGQSVAPPGAQSETGGLWITADRSFGTNGSGTFPIRNIQDGLTDIEKHRYDRIWFSIGTMKEEFELVAEESSGKVFYAGTAAWAKLFKTNERTVRRLILPGLIEKYILELVEAGGMQGKQHVHTKWRIYSYAEALKRQRSQGYIRGVKRGKGIHLVRPFLDGQTVPLLVPPPEGSTDGPPEGQSNRPSLEKTSISFDPRGALDPPGGRVNRPSYPNWLVKTFSTNDDDVDGAAVDALEAKMLKSEHSYFDREAIRQVWSQSREVLPDVSPDEVYEQLIPALRQLNKTPTVQNPTGIICSCWKKQFFTRALVLQSREEARKKAQADLERAQHEEQANIERWRSWLADPMHPQLTQMAREELAKRGLLAEGESA